MDRKPAVVAAIMVTSILAGVNVHAQTLKQSVLSLTGNVHAKMVWVRTSRTSSDIQSRPAYLDNTGYQTTLMSYDTDEEAARTLDADVMQHACPLITRSGEYVISNDIKNKKSYIIAWKTGVKSELISGGAFYVLSCQWDETAHKEYLYTTDCDLTLKNYSADDQAIFTGVWRTELTGTTAAANPTKVLTSTGGEIRQPFLVSSDGKLAGVNYWPDVQVVNIQTGVSSGSLSDGCWVNMAPNASGRFFHLNGPHTSLRMFDVYTASTSSTSVRYVPLNTVLPGNTQNWDVAGPRYSNHVRYISASYPLQDSPADGEFCIGKFNDTFTALTFVKISQTTDREKVGDLWLADGEGPKGASSVAMPDAPPSRAVPLFTLAEGRGMVTVSFTGAKTRSAKLLDVGGRCIAAHGGGSAWSIDTRAVEAGRYVLAGFADGRRSAREVLICK